MYPRHNCQIERLDSVNQDVLFVFVLQFVGFAPSLFVLNMSSKWLVPLKFF